MRYPAAPIFRDEISSPPLPAPLRGARLGTGGDEGEGENKFNPLTLSLSRKGRGIFGNHEAKLRGILFIILGYKP